LEENIVYGTVRVSHQTKHFNVSIRSHPPTRANPSFPSPVDMAVWNSSYSGFAEKRSFSNRFRPASYSQLLLGYVLLPAVVRFCTPNPSFTANADYTN